MKLNWFIRKENFFSPPLGPSAWAIFMAAIAYTIYLFIDIDSRSHSASDTLINWVFNCLIVGWGIHLSDFLRRKLIVDRYVVIIGMVCN